MSKQLSILVTNDDGPESPTLVPLLEHLEQASFCEQVVTVIPPQERSWTSQAVTRDSLVEAKSQSFGQTAGFLLDGTPADCVAIGAFNLCEQLPDVVVSGINIGTNSTSTFTYNSGTVGAARQAAASNIFAIAFSVHVPFDVFASWSERDATKLAALTDCWAMVASLCCAMIEPLYRCFRGNGVDYLSINVPYQANSSTPVQLTRLERWNFKALFEEVESMRFRLRTGMDMAERAADDPRDSIIPGDLSAQLDGLVSVTPFRLDAQGVSQQEAAALSAELQRELKL